MKRLLCIVIVVMALTGCNSIVQDQVIVFEDFKANTKTTTTTKVTDKSFTLGSKGLGTYQVFSVNMLKK